MYLKTAAIVAACVFASSANAAKPILECYANPATDAMQCIDIVSVKLKDSIRTADLHSGGPAEVRKTNFYVAANCQSGVIHLKDKDGVSFAGGYGNETPATKRLKEIVCTAAPKK